MARQANAVLLEKTYKAMIDGDRAELEKLIAPDARIHVPGHNVIAGEYQGIEPIMFFFERVASLTEFTIRREPIDILVGEVHAAALTHITARHGARLLDIRIMLVMEMRDDQVVDLRTFYADQDAWDAFWADQMLTSAPAIEFHPPKSPIDP